MMVKVLSRHTPSFASLLNYILKGSASDTPQIFTHNLRSTTVPGWTQEFLANEADRKLTRANQVYLYHEIISFSTLEDKGKITPEIVEAIANIYIELRGSGGLYFGAVHRDKAHTHIHFCTSGVAFRTGTAMRLSRTELQTLKTELQMYHLNRFPELNRSICEHGNGKPYISDREWRASHNDKRNFNKARIADGAKQCFSEATSYKNFLERLRDSGLHHYERKGQAQGIITEDGTKYRFTRLGIDTETLKTIPIIMSEEEKVLRELRELREDSKERPEDREIISEKNGGTEIIRYNEHLKEVIFRDAKGEETVSYERMNEVERERLDELADKIEHYSEINDQMMIAGEQISADLQFIRGKWQGLDEPEVE